MSDEQNRSGQVSSTPEGGPVDAGLPASQPGAGHVRSTPEAAPLGDGEALVPPTWQEHMAGAIPGLDASGSASGAPPPSTTDWKGVPTTSVEPSPTRADEEELRKWPPYTGKPVSAPAWDALRFAAPVVAQAEKLGIKALGFAGSGLSKLATYLEARRLEREAEERKNASDT